MIHSDCIAIRLGKEIQNRLMRQVFSPWMPASQYEKTEHRKSGSLLWMVFCHYRSPLSRVDHFRDLRIRLAWNVLLPFYRAEVVTWWHVFGLRRFLTPVPHEISGIQVKNYRQRFRYWWYEA